MRYAAVDIGTNSCRLLVMEIQRNGNGNPLLSRIITTRIGEGLSLSGKINRRAMEETIKCLSHFTEIINEYQVTASRAVATSAAREANNHQLFLENIRAYFPGPVDIISGEEEALLTYQGVEQGMKFEKSPLVIDTGGGSTEFVFKNETTFVRSVKLGAVRVTESNMGRAEMQAVLRDIVKEKSKFTGHPVVFVGGTATTLAAIKLKMKIYNPKIIHGQIMSRNEIKELCSMLLNMTLEQRKNLAGLQPERADIICGGARIVSLIMSILELDEMRVSESDILEGIVWGLHRNNS